MMTILMCTSRYALLLYLLVVTSLDVMAIVYYQVDICVTQSVMCLQSLCAIYDMCVITEWPICCMHFFVKLRFIL